ncbi:hypothetical protein GALL_413940 [mine drainage metagenome]|uniref:Uncharacterized protein n=1 Tax=mine drainage metagenome TaxID=410659 RepID=A0A1J5PZM1_9ZZZZ
MQYQQVAFRHRTHSVSVTVKIRKLNLYNSWSQHLYNRPDLTAAQMFFWHILC